MMPPAIRCATAARAEHRRRFGEGRRLPDDLPGHQVIVTTWDGSQEAAEIAAEGNRELYGHPSWAELREGVGWVTVTDLRPAMARIEAERA